MKLFAKHILIFHYESIATKRFYNFMRYLLEENAVLTVISDCSLENKIASSDENHLAYGLDLQSRREKGAFSWMHERKLAFDAPLPYHWIIVWDACFEIPAGSWKDKLLAACSFYRTFVSFFGNDDKSDIDLESYYEKDFTPSSNSNIDSLQKRKTLAHNSWTLRSSDSLSDVSSLADDDSYSATTLFDSVSESPRSTIVENRIARKGVLYLVGVGPGNPELLTIRAHKLIHSCPVIISDRLVCNDIYSSIPSSTRLLFSRKVCGKANLAQDEINNWILENLNAGYDVARAKGGDPFVFGRGGEEWNLARKAGFQVEWVPGISSSIAAAGAAGIPVTHRGVADSFVVATGQLQNGTTGTIPKYSPKRTLILLMAVGVLKEIESVLVELDYPNNCPVAIIHRGTWPDQKFIRGELKNIAQKVKSAGITSHATIVVGHVVDCLVSLDSTLLINA